IGVPNLTLWVGTLAGGVKRSAIGGAYLAKVPGAFGGAWDTGLRRGRRGFAGTVPIEEEEGLILEDRTADGAAIVIAAERWDGLPIMIGKPAIGIENLVADKVVAFAMKDVGPGLRDHVDDRTAGESILGAEVGLLDFEFLYGFDRRRIGDLRNAPVRLEVRDRGAIHQNVGGGVTAAIGDEVGAGTACGALVIRFVDAWSQGGQIQQVAVGQGQIFDKT